MLLIFLMAYSVSGNMNVALTELTSAAMRLLRSVCGYMCCQSVLITGKVCVTIKL